MIVSAPDTPNVCPTCDDTGLVAPLGGRGSDGPDPCPHCTPAAGSSSPDVAALVAELRGAASMFAEDPDGTAWVVTPDTTLLADLRAAADALESLTRWKAEAVDVIRADR